MNIILTKRFWDKVIIKNSKECWNWIGGKNKGYGIFYYGKSYSAHRLLFLSIYGSIPKGLQVDHKCRNRSCVNPHHLRLLTNKENVLIGIGPTAINKRKTHCPKGHEYNNKNTYIDKNGWRNCRHCHRTIHKKIIKSKINNCMEVK